LPCLFSLSGFEFQLLKHPLNIEVSLLTGILLPEVVVIAWFKRKVSTQVSRILVFYTVGLPAVPGKYSPVVVFIGYNKNR